LVPSLRSAPVILGVMSAERERIASRKLQQMLAPHFHVTPEVDGSWPLDNRALRLDLLVRPLASAIELGFDVEAFGIEVKDPKSKESVRKLLDCIMQAYTYGFCEFDGVRPAFVLVYPDIEKFFQHDFVHKYTESSSEQYSSRELRLMRRIMQRANVGELLLHDQYGYEFRFEGGRFFDPVRGRTKVKGLGVNRYVGSGKTRT
jgi:hypothetical protein